MVEPAPAAEPAAPATPAVDPANPIAPASDAFYSGYADDIKNEPTIQRFQNSEQLRRNETRNQRL